METETIVHNGKKVIKKIKKDFWGYNIISKNNTNFPLKCSGQAEKCAKKLIHLIGQEI